MTDGKPAEGIRRATNNRTAADLISTCRVHVEIDIL